MIFRCNLGDEARTEVIREIFVENGEKYRCKKTYSEEFTPKSVIFEKDEWYEMKEHGDLHASFYSPSYYGNSSSSYYLKTYVEDCLFEHFDFTKTHRNKVLEQRYKIIDSLHHL